MEHAGADKSLARLSELQSLPRPAVAVVMGKLGASTRTEAVVEALRRGLIRL